MWIYAFLHSGGAYHRRLADWFAREERFWVGPVEAPLEQLVRRYGPEETMQWKEAPEIWERRVAAILDVLNDPDDLPPMLARAVAATPGDEAGPFRLWINDGSHRHEALKRFGAATGWVIVWFDTAAQQRAFMNA